MPEPTLSEGAPSGRERLLTTLRSPGSKGQITAFVLLAVLGFGAVVQVRANNREDRYAGASQQDLIQLINTLELANDRTERQIQSLAETRDSLKSNTVANRTALEIAREQAASLGILAGALAATGPGVEVTVDGPPASVGTEQLLAGFQELRDAGAEAMQINRAVRVVAQTAISDGPDDSVIIDGKQLQAPFVIQAIGDPASLAPAVFFPEGFADEVEKVGGTVEVRRFDTLTIDTTRTLTPAEYAKPAG